MKNLKKEISRVKGEEQESISVDRQDYLNLLKELKTLRFKVCSRIYWKPKPEGHRESSSGSGHEKTT